jgi:hypothetical protein
MEIIAHVLQRKETDACRYLVTHQNLGNPEYESNSVHVDCKAVLSEFFHNKC